MSTINKTYAEKVKDEGASFSALDHGRFREIEKAIDDTVSIGGEIWCCGAWRGGTALWMKGHLMMSESPRVIRAFDTFQGLPFSKEDIDMHPIGAMKSDYDEVAKRLDYPNIFIHTGIMPDSFVGLEDSIISGTYRR